MSNASSRAPERPFVKLYVDELKDPRRLDLPDHLQAIHLLLLVHSIREDSKQPWTKGRDGEVLIPVADLAALRKCSPSTIRRAHRALIEKGFCCRKNGKLWVLPVPTGAAPDAQIDDLEAARDAHGAAPDARETAPDAHSMCISCRPEDANDAMNPCGRRAAGETGDASDSIQEYQNVSDIFISHCGEATTTQTTDDDEVGFFFDEERRDESEDIPTVVPRIQAVAVAVVPGAPEVPARQQRRDDGDTTPPIPPPPQG